MAERAWLGLGSNLGDSSALMTAAIVRLEAHPGIEVRARSGLYRTPAWGIEDQPDFLNAALAIETTLGPHDLLDAALAIEAELGRVRGRRWGERAIDIDLLHYRGAAMRDERLTLPHPLWRQRGFVLLPLAEISPRLVIDGVTVADAAAQADRRGIVRLAMAW